MTLKYEQKVLISAKLRYEVEFLLTLRTVKVAVLFQ